LDRLEPLLKLVETNQRITLLTKVKLLSIGGFHPLFSIKWFHDNTTQSVTAGHIVFAMGLEMRFPKTLYPGTPGDGVIMLPDLERTTCRGDWSEVQGKRVLMVCGYQDPPSAYGIHLMMDRSLAMAQNGARVIVAMPNALFHSPDTPRLFRHCREQGVLFIRSAEPPVVSGTYPDLHFEVEDPALGDARQPALLHGHIDRVVYEPEYHPRTLKNIFWSPHHPATGFDGYYQPDNPNFKPVRSERRGIYYVGAITGFKSLSDCREEVAQATSEILMDHPENPTHAEVDETQCVVCLTCARICPHRAIYIDGTARVSKDACDGCGICVAECPARAIKLVQPGPDDYRDGYTPLEDHFPEWVVLYCCNGSTGPAWDSVRPNPLLDRYHLHVLRVPCSGRIAVSHLLDHLKQGAAGILVAACPKDCCDHVHGNLLAANRVRRVRDILKALDLNPDRVQITHVAGGMHDKLKHAVDEFCSRFLTPRSENPDAVSSTPPANRLTDDHRHTQTP